MSGLGGRMVKATSSAARALGNALDNLGASMEVAKYSEKLVPSTRFVAVDGVEPKASPDCAFVAPSASLIGDVTVGKNSSIWYGAAIRGDVHKIEIGDNSSIGDRAVVHVAKIAADSPTFIGNNVTVGPGSIIHACTLKDNCSVGASSTILDGAVVESDAIVAPGSLVTANTVVKSKTLYAGSPAKMVRELTSEEVSNISKESKEIVELAFMHAFECSKTLEQIHEDELEYDDKLERDPDYLWQPEQANYDNTNVQGMGTPGLIFDDALSNPTEWLKQNEAKIKENYLKARSKTG